MRIVFFGASELGYVCCESILANGHQVVGIFTIPQQFNISYSPGKPVHNVLYKDFGVLAQKYNLPIFYINGDLKNYINELVELKPDLILAVGWYYMFPKSMLQIAKKGAAGIHASLLPKYRGNAPLVWALINGETKTGVSFFYFSDGVDKGDIIAQEEFVIDANDTIKDLLLKTEKAALKILLESLPKLSNNEITPIQQDHGLATTYPKRGPEDGLIDWSKSAHEIKNFIRAQTKPYPGAFTYINGKKVIIWDADIIEP